MDVIRHFALLVKIPAVDPNQMTFTPGEKLFIFDCVIVFLMTMAWLEVFQIKDK